MRIETRLLQMFSIGCGLLAASCMTSPKDGWNLQSTWSAVPFEGMTNVPGAVVHLAVFNNATQRWDDFATITAETAPVTDATGTDWYKWGRRSFMIPDRQHYWGRDDRGINKVYAQVKAYDSRNNYFSFAPGAETCFEANQSGGGLVMATNCRSSHSPSAMLSAPCGTHGIVSCDGWCNAGLARDSNNRCRPCGGENQLCCSSSTIGATGECNANLACQRDEQICRSGIVFNPPGSIVQACPATGCEGHGRWDGSPGCFFERTKTSCWGVALFCNDVHQCGFDPGSLTPIRSESGWYLCGACIGLPF